MTNKQDRIEELQKSKRDYKFELDILNKKLNDLQNDQDNILSEKTRLCKRIHEISEDIKYVDKQIVAVKTYKERKGKLS